MRITDLAIDRSTTVVALMVLISIVGIYSYIVLPRESNPEVVIPYVTVTVMYEGVSPEDMESLVTVPIERKLTGLSDVKQIQSTSVEGVSNTVIEFEADTVIEDALQRVRDKVDQAESDLPVDADDPMVSEINISEFPILVLNLTGKLPLPLLNRIAEDLEDRIETIQGVLDVQIIGGVEREIQIEVDPDRVTRYGVSFAELISITQLENVNTPGGAMELGEAKYLMRTPGEFRTPEELEGLIVKSGPNGNVHLRDIAVVRDGFKDTTSISRVNGDPSITLTVSKRSGSNIIAIADQVNYLLEEARKHLPSGVDVVLTWDESVWIRDMVAELESSILTGLILVLAVIFVFLGFANAVFVSLAIPVSMFIAFAVLNFFGITLNMVVLFSLILALGMLVDNGIVIVENIHRHVQWGEERHSAAKRGASEVAWPIIGSTVTTIVAFVPMFFWPGIFGEFMVYLPLTVCVSLGGSLFVGLIANPALAAMFMHRRVHAGSVRRERHPVLHAYAALLRLALRWRAVTVTLSVVVLTVILSIYAIDPKTEFMPTVEPPQAYIDIEAPQGTSLAASDGYVRLAERVVAPYRDNVEFVIANVGSQGADLTGGMSGGASSTHKSRVTLDFPVLEDTTIAPSQLIERIRAELRGITGARVRIDQMGMGPPTGPPVNVEISGEDFGTLARLAEEVERLIRDIPGIVDLRDDYDKGKPEVRVVVDRQRAWQAGLSTQAIGVTVQAAVSGRKAGEYREADEEYDVTVRFPQSFREDLRHIQDMELINAQGSPVPLSAVAKIEPGAGLGTIKRIDRKRTVTVSADVAAGSNAREVLAEVQKTLKETFTLPGGYAIEYTGENEDTEETMAFLARAFVAAVLLITLVLVAQFNSILQPIIIMTSVVLSLAGVFVGLMICDMPFSILMSGIGCISLAGVVVNNAIVLMDFINNARARGASCDEAIVEAGITRFRPVMLTAVTTVLGLIPMALGISVDFRSLVAGDWGSVVRAGGESSQWWGPMAIAVIFGLSFATILTLVVVPTLYSLLDSVAEALRPRVVEPNAQTDMEAPAK